MILLAAAACWIGRPQAIPGYDWVNQHWLAPVNWKLIAGQLSMFATSGYYTNLDVPMWTLVHELRISIIFPPLAMLTLLYPRSLLAACSTILLLSSVTHFTNALGAMLRPPLLKDLMLSLIDSAHFVIFFALGAMISTREPRLEGLLTRHPGIRTWLCLVAPGLLGIPALIRYFDAFYVVGASA